ncbi:sigma-70 family RNA polymerase sigma factor [Streptomyces sp. 8N616]|uniref:sigma-70 family RNA polymerase sigma factor n=1 Tax=Streptomyces sp. 8N616 TaxID=3457414 RepID=UPI003FD2C0E8
MRRSIMGSLGTDSPREQAVRRLYDEHRDALHNYVVRLLGGDRDKAEDIVQETLLRYWFKHDQDDPGSLTRAWLFTVARNLVIDGYRKRVARPQEVYGGAWMDVLHDSESDSLDSLLTSLVVDDALQALSPMHREVIYETYFAGRTAPAAARRLGIPIGTVKSRLYYGMRALRLALEERGVRSPVRQGDREVVASHSGSP